MLKLRCSGAASVGFRTSIDRPSGRSEIVGWSFRPVILFGFPKVRSHPGFRSFPSHVCESSTYPGVGHASDPLIDALLSNYRYLGIVLKSTSLASPHATIRTPGCSGSIGGSRTGYWTKVAGMSSDMRFVLGLHTLSSEGQGVCHGSIKSPPCFRFHYSARRHCYGCHTRFHRLWPIPIRRDRHC